MWPSPWGWGDTRTQTPPVGAQMLGGPSVVSATPSSPCFGWWVGPGLGIRLGRLWSLVCHGPLMKHSGAGLEPRWGGYCCQHTPLLWPLCWAGLGMLGTLPERPSCRRAYSADGTLESGWRGETKAASEGPGTLCTWSPVTQTIPTAMPPGRALQFKKVASFSWAQYRGGSGECSHCWKHLPFINAYYF